MGVTQLTKSDWQPLPDGHMKINFDGAVLIDITADWAQLVVRNHDCKFSWVWLGNLSSSCIQAKELLVDSTLWF